MIQRIRMLKSVARKFGYIPEGSVLYIPRDLDEATALAWLKAGLAAEDKMIDSIPETKTEKPAKKKEELTMADLVTLANVKSYLWSGESITTWDAILPTIISAVSDLVKRELGCDVEHTHYTSVKASGGGSSLLHLPNWPITVVSAIEDEDGTTYTEGYDEDFVITPLPYAFSLKKNSGVWARGISNFTVSYEAGWATIPSEIVLVCYEVIARAWKTMKEQGWGESGRTMPDGSTSTVSAAFEITKAQRAILAKFKRVIL